MVAQREERVIVITGRVEEKFTQISFELRLRDERDFGS